MVGKVKNEKEERFTRGKSAKGLSYLRRFSKCKSEKEITLEPFFSFFLKKVSV